jgi:predicted P-loop ATPase
MRSADREALKAFITFAERTFRRPYDRNPIVKPALASFVGTINNESGFLTDPTGNRRFLIATVDRIDWGYSTKVTPDQFWAQIMHWHREGQTWELTEEEAARRDDQNGDYELADVYQDAIERYFWLSDDPAAEEFMTTEQIMQHLIASGVRDTPRSMTMAIGAAMRRMRRQKKRPRVEGQLARGYTGIAPKASEQ